MQNRGAALGQKGRHYDACVIGSGASGAVVASELVCAGWDVLVLEQGAHVKPGTYLHDLIPSFETARARDIDGRWTEQGYPWTACCVGGGTRFYAGISLRLRLVDFDVSAHVVDEALPPAWPFGYEELRPHYEWVERRIGVSSDAELDPHRPSSGIGSLPPHRASARGAALSAAARARGLRPFPAPLAIAPRRMGSVPACADLTTCTDFVCPSGAKGDVYERLTAPLLGKANLTLRARVKATRLLERAPGQVAQLECVDLDRRLRERISAGVFVLSANAVQTSALLLRSSSRRSPAGLGNRFDMVGRGLCMKVGQNMTGRLGRDLAQPVPRAGGRWTTVALSDYYVDAGCPTGLGGMILETGPLDPADRADRSLVRVECLLADQPLARNRVLADEGRLTMDYRPHPIDLRRLDFMRERAGDLLADVGARTITVDPLDFTLGSCHFHGTCRMGTDPRTSVCDPTGRLHEVDNVFVADGALMPYPGAVNPTLTIQALAHRVAEGLVARGR